MKIKIWKVFILILLLVIGYCSYWLFYPRFTYIAHNYEWGKYRIDNLSCNVRLNPDYHEQENKNIKIYRSPYDIWISFEAAENCYISVTKVNILANQKVVYTSDIVKGESFQKGEWKSFCYDKDVTLEYLDYTVILEYIQEVDGKKKNGSIKVLLKQKYRKEKYNMIDKMMSV